MSNTSNPVSSTSQEHAKTSAPATTHTTSVKPATEVPSSPGKKEATGFPTAGSKSDIDNHKLASVHHSEAAKYHLEAVKHHEEGNHEKAAASTIKAAGHGALANDCLKEDVSKHATQN